MQETRLPTEFAVEDLLQTFPALALGEDEIVVFDRARREWRLVACVSNDVRGERAIRIETHIGLAEHLVGRHAALNGRKLAGKEIRRKIQGQHAPVLVVVQNRRIREANVAVDETRGESHLLTGEGDDF